ncbi:toprim domain-containing protein [Pseudodesulfovibrio senegalensis]|uniref:toprim domain-containing protein n=1 Tax=Pseudodesulfovibrio senegalensis TaxID=1721087 RepID=UPI001F4F62A7|nr:toprim domain-containing protein [Pseudodesulfovibrio senegalensis]
MSRSSTVLADPGVYGYGVKVNDRNELLVPGRDVEGFIHTLQTVNQDGKFFVAGSRKTGTFHTIDPDRTMGNPQTPILIAEGYATAASVHMAIGEPVHAAFDAGNLKHVAEALHGKYPDRSVVILSDNDHQQSGNPGVTKAQAAARAVGGQFVVPLFSDAEKAKGLTDFNDLHATRGLEAVRKQLEPVLQKVRGKGLEQQEDGLAMSL